MHPKHSVIIITYNQEKLIGRALESVLCQRDFLFEIVVCDDCSTDETWKVVQRYYSIYPDLIKPFRNKRNLGIFGNIESTWTKATGDIIWYLSGDDTYCNKLFEKANDLIKENNLDLNNDFFTLYFDFMKVFPSGKRKIFSNYRIKKYNPISLKLRNLIYNRTTGISKKVYKSFFHISNDMGIMADGLIDIQTQLFSKYNLYSPYIGSLYFKDIGISSRTKTIQINISTILIMDELLAILVNINNKDISWIYYLKYKSMYYNNPSFEHFIKSLRYLFISIDLKYGLKYWLIELLRFLYILIKTLYKHTFVNTSIRWI